MSAEGGVTAQLRTPRVEEVAGRTVLRCPPCQASVRSDIATATAAAAASCGFAATCGIVPEAGQVMVACPDCPREILVTQLFAEKRVAR